MVTESVRGRLAIITYWTLFVLVPPILPIVIWGGGVGIYAVSIGLLLMLFILASRGFRLWKRLWGLE